MKRTEIPLSKKKVTLLSLGGLLFIFLGLLMIFMLSDWRWSLFDILFKAIGLLGAAFGGLALYIGGKKLLDPRPGLIIDAAGITDNSSGSSLGFIPWDEITAIHRSSVMDIPMLLIELKNPKDYIKRAKGLNNTLLRQNHEMYGTPLAIAGNTLKCKFETLVGLLEEAIAEASKLRNNG
jgi:hypothetical protein